MIVTPEIDVAELPASRVAEYAAVSVAYRVERRLVLDAPPFTFREVAVAAAYEKDYDQLGETPMDWSLRFDLARWGLFVARQNGEICGGAAVAPPGDVMRGVSLPPGTAVLWDIRVAPQHRGRGVGAALFRAARAWDRAHGYAGLVAETQDVNVGAVRFYLKMGCTVIACDPGAYESLPDEARIILHRT